MPNHPPFAPAASAVDPCPPTIQINRTPRPETLPSTIAPADYPTLQWSQRQGFLLLPILFNIFVERIMLDAVEKQNGKVSFGGRNITNLRFADVIDAPAEEEQELEVLVETLDKTCTRYRNKINVEKTKMTTRSTNSIQREIKGRSWAL